MAMAPPAAGTSGDMNGANRCVKTEKAMEKKTWGQENLPLDVRVGRRDGGGAYGREPVADGRRLRRLRWIPARHVKRRGHRPLAAPINFSGDGALTCWHSARGAPLLEPRRREGNRRVRAGGASGAGEATAPCRTRTQRPDGPGLVLFLQAGKREGESDDSEGCSKKKKMIQRVQSL